MNYPRKEDRPYFKFAVKSLTSPLSLSISFQCFTCNSCFQKTVFEKIFLGYLFVFFTSKQQNSENFPLMGGSRNWIKSLIGQKSVQIKDHVSSNFWV